MRKIFVDLEMCPIPDEYVTEKEICKLETIEIGAVMLDEEGKEITSFKEYVKPAYAVEIPRHIEKLTGIQYSTVQEAASFGEVLRRFTDWCRQTDYTIFSWSENDLLQILQETALKKIEDTGQLSYMYHHWKDFQQEYCGLFPMDHVMSLEKAVNYCGIEFKGRAHDGLNDARATADLYRVIHDKESFEEFQEHVLDCFKPKSISKTLADLFDFSAFQTAVSAERECLHEKEENIFHNYRNQIPVWT